MNLKKFTKFELSLHGEKVFYMQSSGNGPTILFLHGLGIDTRIWDKVLAEIDDRFNIVLLDLPGYGSNIGLHISTEFNDISKFIFNFIEKKGSISHLVGYSLSGVFSYHIAQNPPSSLKKIILVSTPIFHNNSIFFLKKVFQIVGASPFITKIVRFFIKRFPVKQLIFLLGRLGSITNTGAMNDCMQKFGEGTDLPYVFTFASTIFSPTKFAKISIPVEFIYGELDGFATVSAVKKSLSICKSSHLHIIKDVYHLMPLEKPLVLMRLIEESCKIKL